VSGFVGIVDPTGAPIDRSLLHRMTDFLAYRGPDAQAVEVEGVAGLGHAMLRTTREAEHERQPATLDGKVWIVADARIDARDRLERELAARGPAARPATADAELILRAYHAWGEDCVEHLLGDFAFAVWDPRRRRLFGARDHFGVKLFYYAHLGRCLVVSNTLDCLRLHPAVSDALNDQAVADFLLFGANRDPATTTFADVQRLPPAHTLSYAVDGPLRVRRYWTLSVGGETRYARASDYVERFGELLDNAVADRLRTDRIGVLMSGGLDSTAVAATARRLLLQEARRFDLHAYTAVSEALIPDQERRYAAAAADALGIPISYLTTDAYGLYARWGEPELRRPEPVDVPLLAIHVDQMKRVAARGRVALTGWDGDALLRERPAWYFRALLAHRRFGRLAADVGRYVVSQGALPRTGLRTGLKRWLSGKDPQAENGAPAFPRWLNPSFAERLDLRARWAHMAAEPPAHPRRPYAMRVLTALPWVELFESYDPGMTSCPVEVRHPLLDLRVVDYALSIPPVPWCIDKTLLRAATRDVLPDSVRCRPKSPLAGDPVMELLRRGHPPWVNSLAPVGELAQYVDWDAFLEAAGGEVTKGLCVNMSPWSLNHWLLHCRNLIRQRGGHHDGHTCG
jgi:asparagine synthase (glutamine-hydrolysing)